VCIQIPWWIRRADIELFMVFNKAGVKRKEEHHTILTLKMNCYSLQRTSLIRNKLS